MNTVLSAAIRQEKEIKGIQNERKKYTIIIYNEVTLYIENPNEAIKKPLE